MRQSVYARIQIAKIKYYGLGKTYNGKDDFSFSISSQMNRSSRGSKLHLAWLFSSCINCTDLILRVDKILHMNDQS